MPLDLLAVFNYHSGNLSITAECKEASKRMDLMKTRIEAIAAVRETERRIAITTYRYEMGKAKDEAERGKLIGKLFCEDLPKADAKAQKEIDTILREIYSKMIAKVKPEQQAALVEDFCAIIK